MIVERVLSRYSVPQIAKLAFGWGGRRLTAGRRRLPDFLIIGGQRCGTTSLYNYIIQHPQVEPAFIKETHFFDRAYRRGVDWYRSFFPLRSQAVKNEHSLTGEATPYYLFDPHVPPRVASVVPQAKLIVLLRNPVERAYSHYKFESRMGIEQLDFESAIERELEHFPKEEEKVLKDADYQSDIFSRFSYLARGIYLPQIKRWQDNFEQSQILILQSEDFYEHTGKVLQSVFDFLGLPDVSISDRKTYNATSDSPMTEKVRSRLAAYFSRPNQQLYEHLGRNFNWDTAGSQK